MEKKLLRSVSRSFYLSIKALPREMREPVSLGYLFARASDTIADTASVPKETRLALLEQFRVQMHSLGEESGKLAGHIKRDLVSHLTHQGEVQLMEQLTTCFAWLNNMERADQHMVSSVLGHITRGQVWDVEQFGDSSPENPAYADTAEELKQYTWWVAGSVGEFWTGVGFANCGESFSYEPISEMRAIGSEYGQGLQLVNVLRDIGEDLQRGRCYLPRQELCEAGWDGQGVPSEEHILAVSDKWRDQCLEWIQSGRKYAGRLRSRRIRFATILPLLIAERTMDLLKQAGAEALQTKVKVSRGEIRKLMWQAMWVKGERPDIVVE